MLSIFDIFKVGVGPSSSHTNGPMLAGYHFTRQLAHSITKTHRVQVDLFGSLSLTGKGHHTDRAVILGLLGNKPDTIKMTSAKTALSQAIEGGKLSLASAHTISFSYESDILFHSDNLPLHENGMSITAYDALGAQLFTETYYSIGGGFIATADEMQNGKQQ
ncbi:serine dehydratase beta chain, partial [Vibrio sinaloensis]